MHTIIIVADDQTGCENGKVRLQGGSQPSIGYVEFCHSRRWGGVCNNDWDVNDARVVCRQLNYDPNGMLCLLPLISS